MIKSRRGFWPIEDFGLRNAVEEVCDKICDSCPVSYVEIDTGACTCPVDTDYFNPGCYRFPCAREIEDYFMYIVLPFCQERLRNL